MKRERIPIIVFFSSVTSPLSSFRNWTWLLLGTALAGGWACTPPPAEVVPAVQESSDSDLLGPSLFEEVTASSGIDFTYRNGEDLRPQHLSILESLGGGVA